ncbi:DUF308 domain-containing protein [Nesterenkonia populi]|uniref:DUF308 domain-containing protein n=1 Tax=Nesterenkonia populi TaxID=1591087 RepID=UPI001FE716B7|nr:DUF308 domain-containing protein [Nesterenkonia populi]
MTAPHQPAASEITSDSPSRRNILGITALVTAVVGAVFACIPGALIVGWVLLPIAFILGLVSLFLKGRGRGTGIAAVIISVVGTVIGFIVFFAVVAGAIDESFNQDTAAETPEESDDAAGEGEQAPAEDEEPAEEGTRENPYPLGTRISSGDWAVTVNSVDLDAEDAVLAENQFNEPPEDGSTYILVNITAEYTGSDAEGDMPWASVEYVSSEGSTFTEADVTAVAPDAFDSLTTLYEGASETGNIALHVPADDVTDGTLAVTPDMLGDTVFVALD